MINSFLAVKKDRPMHAREALFSMADSTKEE